MLRENKQIKICRVVHKPSQFLQQFVNLNMDILVGTYICSDIRILYLHKDLILYIIL